MDKMTLGTRLCQAMATHQLQVEFPLLGETFFNGDEGELIENFALAGFRKVSKELVFIGRYTAQPSPVLLDSKPPLYMPYIDVCAVLIGASEAEDISYLSADMARKFHSEDGRFTLSAHLRFSDATSLLGDIIPAATFA